MSDIDEKLRIYLTDQVRGRASGKALGLSNQIMLSVGDFYNQPALAENYRGKYGMTDVHQAGWDSGGFQFLMGKLRGVPMEALPCGIEVPIDASRTIDLYKRVGSKPQDLPIQLDLPPRYDLPPEHRVQLIERSVLYYYEMMAEIPETVPTIHGWTLEEIEHNLELVMDPDKASKIVSAGSNLPLHARNKSGPVGAGSYKGSRNNWTMGNLNPHDGKVAAGTFGQPARSAVDFANGMWGRQRKNRKPVGVGSYKALTHSTDYLVHTDNSANPFRDLLRNGRVATAWPGSLDLRPTTPLVDRVRSKRVAVGTYAAPPKSAVDHVHSNKKVVAVGTNAAIAGGNFVGDHVLSKRKTVATPIPGRVDAGIAQPDDQPQVAAPRKVATGSNVPLSVGPLGEKMVATGSQAASGIVGRKRAPYSIIVDRIAMVLNRLRDEYEVFMLGGASPHTQHQVFLAGARFTDTSAWRIKALLGEIYLPEHSSGHNAFGIGYSQKTRRMDQEAVEILKDCLADPRHPFSGMYWKEFMEIGHMLMPQWKRLAIKRNYPARPFVLRARHNAFVLKCREEEIANEYVCDPDRYFNYLKRRLKPRPILSKRLAGLWERLQRPYVQTDLRVYIKGRKK
jgi:hypothetical protein